MHAFGTEPASQIEIWIRGRFNEGGAWGLRHATVPFLAAGRELRYVAVSATAQEQERCPFHEFFRDAAPPPSDRYYVGWTWQRIDDAAERLSGV